MPVVLAWMANMAWIYDDLFRSTRTVFWSSRTSVVILFCDIVDNNVHGLQHINIVESCFHQPGTG